MTWRPEGWKNPNDKWPVQETYDEQQLRFAKGDAHEAGADALLKALKAKGTLMTPEQMRLLAPDRKYSFGWLIFIEEA